MKKRKRMLKGFLSMALLCSIILLPLHKASAFDEEKAPVSEAPDTSKISSELAEIMASAKDDALIPVYIFRHLMQAEKLQALVYAETGMNSVVYENQSLFESQIVPILEAKAEAQYGYEKAHAWNEETMSTSIEDAIAVEIDSYLEAKRSIVKREYVEENAQFAEKYIDSSRELFYAGSYTSTIAVEATKAEIAAYAELPDVEKIMYFEDLIDTPELDITAVQVAADVTKSNGYKGSGVVIGIIEAGAGRYDPDSLMLSGIPASQLSYVPNVHANGRVVTPSITSHATKVTEIIVGKSTNVGSRTFEGYAPDATVYQIASSTTSDLYNAFAILVEKGVHVINYSAGSSTSGYSSYDKEIDRLISTTNVSFVKSAGNSAAEITSPGKALNAVTVGSAETKSSSSVSLTAPFSMASYSSYTEASYLPNKPDIAAPGSVITTPASTTTTTSGSGTSYAAPIITAIMAQTMQRSAVFKINPYAAKAFIVLCADYGKISTANNTSVGSYLYDQSGAGLIIASNLRNGFNGIYGSLSATGNTSTFGSYAFTAGQKIRVVMVFGKNNTLSISSSANTDDIDLRILDSSGNIVASSSSARNNIEIIEYIIPTTGTYSFQAYAYRVVDTASRVPYAIYWMHK